LIQQIRRYALPTIRPIGIGDDCAVLRIPARTKCSSPPTSHREHSLPPRLAHSRRRRPPLPFRGLSDIAAMGGDPQAAFLSLAVPIDCPESG